MAQSLYTFYKHVENEIGLGTVVDGLWIRHAMGTSWLDPSVYYTMGYHIRGEGKAEAKKHSEWRWVRDASSWSNDGFGHNYDALTREGHYGEDTFLPDQGK